MSLSDQITTPSLSTLTEATIRSPSDVLSVASSGPSINPHLHSDEDRSLFNHYFHIVAHVLSRSGDPAGNLFLTAMLPMAAASDTLTSVLLGLSGCHWRRVYPSIWKRALARQGRGMSYVFPPTRRGTWTDVNSLGTSKPAPDAVRSGVDARSVRNSASILSNRAMRRHLAGVEVASQSGTNIAHIRGHRFARGYTRGQVLSAAVPLPRQHVDHRAVQATTLTRREGTG